MASPSGTSSGSTLVQSSGSEEELQQLMDQRKRRRMISNRESARRSRMKKQKHLDDLTAQVAQLTDEKNQIVLGINVFTQLCLNIDGENAILRAQATELGRRLEALNEIIVFMNGGTGYFGTEEVIPGFESINNPWTSSYLSQPVVVSSDMLLY
ncbi:hypothetical protein U1Q18_003835 [Sarracenia purpurea var. burkii]